jgi:hypothetical protein
LRQAPSKNARLPAIHFYLPRLLIMARLRLRPLMRLVLLRLSLIPLMFILVSILECVSASARAEKQTQN